MASSPFFLIIETYISGSYRAGMVLMIKSRVFPRHILTYGNHPPGNLVSRNHRVTARHPVTVNLM